MSCCSAPKFVCASVSAVTKCVHTCVCGCSRKKAEIERFGFKAPPSPCYSAALRGSG